MEVILAVFYVFLILHGDSNNCAVNKGFSQHINRCVYMRAGAFCEQEYWPVITKLEIP